VLQKHISPHTLPGEWKLPLNLAIGLHLLVLLSAIFLPKLLNQHPILPEITTIDLMSAAEPAAKNEPAAPAATSAPKEIKATKLPIKQEVKTEIKEEVKEEIKEEIIPPKPAEIIKSEVAKKIPPPIEKPVPTPEPVAPPVPAEAISIKPLKQKQKKEIKEIPDTRAEDAKIRKDELKNITKQLQQEVKNETAAQETIRKQRQVAAAREEARRAELEARMAAADAKEALRDQLRTSSTSTSKTASSQAGTGSAKSMGVLEQQYYATIMGHIQQYWRPPDVKSWDPTLLAVVSITIASDGQIVSHTFEQESGDRLFDEFVLKTLEAANPLPAPPAALQKQRFEVGLKFKPSGIQ
jgi:colicin import membrane protein